MSYTILEKSVQCKKKFIYLMTVNQESHFSLLGSLQLPVFQGECELAHCPIHIRVNVSWPTVLSVFIAALVTLMEALTLL